MLKFKNKFLPLILFLFILATSSLLYLLSFGFKTHAEASESDVKDVYMANYTLFNIYSEDSTNVAMGMGKFGMLIGFDDVLSDTRSKINGGIREVNLIDLYGDNIKINDIPLNFYSYAEVCYFCENYIWIYIPNIDNYRKISVDEEFTFLDRKIQPFSLYSARNIIGTYWTSSANEHILSIWTNDGTITEVNKNTESVGRLINYVDYVGIKFNNVGYQYFSPQDGLLLQFNANLTNSASEKEGAIREINLVNNSFVEGFKSIGRKVFLTNKSGVRKSFADITDAEIKYHSEGYIWFFVPNMIDYVKFEIEGYTGDGYIDNIITRIPETSTKDRALFLDSYLPSVTLYTNGNQWVEFDPNRNRDKHDVEYNSCDWSNNGILLDFDNNLSNIVDEINGGISDENLLRRKFIGEDISIGKKVFLADNNNIIYSFDSIPGAEIKYLSNTTLWFFVPDMKSYTKFEIEPDTLVLDSYLPKVTLNISNETLTLDNEDSVLNLDPVKYPGSSDAYLNKNKIKLYNVSYDNDKLILWNNTTFVWAENGKSGLLLEFDENLSKLDSEIQGGIRNINKVKTSIGEHIKLNGTPLIDIVGAEISYHSERFLWIYIPSDKLNIVNPHLTIDENTVFLNAILPEISVYFDGSYWWTDLSDKTYGINAFSKIIENENNSAVDGNDGYVYTRLVFNDNFTASEDNHSASSRPNFAQIGDAGHNISVNGKTLNQLYKEDSYTCCMWGEENYIYLRLRKADLYPTTGYPITTLKIKAGTKFMDRTIAENDKDFTLYLVNGKWKTDPSDSSTSPTNDVDAPYIYYYGENEYLLFTGADDIDFNSLMLAFDEVDGILSDGNVSIEYPKGAITGNKWNHGTWTIKIIAQDNSVNSNKTEKDITVTVIDKSEQYLSVYVNGFFSHRVKYGENIRADKSEMLNNNIEPEKSESNSSYYVFTGWTVDGKPFDIENDIVTTDINLKPTYKEYKRLYTLTIKNKETDESETMIVKYGDVIDFSDYQKDGYSLLAKVNNVSVNKLTITDDATVLLEYTPIESSNDNTKKTIIIIVCGWSGAALIISAGFLIIKKHGKKAGI